jgi:hypothetical protein
MSIATTAASLVTAERRCLPASADPAIKTIANTNTAIERFLIDIASPFCASLGRRLKFPRKVDTAMRAYQGARRLDLGGIDT